MKDILLNLLIIGKFGVKYLSVMFFDIFTKYYLFVNSIILLKIASEDKTKLNHFYFLQPLNYLKKVYRYDN